MKLEVNVEKRYAIIVSVILLALVGVGLTIAYGGSSPSSVGHSFGELEGVQARIANGLTQCAGSNLAIKTIDPATGVVTCETDDSGSGGAGTITTSIVASTACGGVGTRDATCPAGTVRVGCGGGCTSGSSVYFTTPINSPAQTCRVSVLSPGATGNAYAICASIS